jgi:hypothetical protein
MMERLGAGELRSASTMRPPNAATIAASLAGVDHQRHVEQRARQCAASNHAAFPCFVSSSASLVAVLASGAGARRRRRRRHQALRVAQLLLLAELARLVLDLAAGALEANLLARLDAERNVDLVGLGFLFRIDRGAVRADPVGAAVGLAHQRIGQKARRRQAAGRDRLFDDPFIDDLAEQRANQDRQRRNDCQAISSAARDAE